jgi:hypothetical protein
LQGVCERLQHGGGDRQKAAVEVHYSQEPLKSLSFLWLRKTLHRLYMVAERLDAAGGDPMPKELHLAESKLALAEVHHHPIILEPLQHAAQRLLVLVRPTSHNDVVQVRKGGWQIGGEAFHKALERLAGVAQPKRHTQKLEKAKWGYNSCFWHVRCRHRYLKIAFFQVYLAEDGAASELGGHVGDVRQRVLVRDRRLIQQAVVAAGPPCPVAWGILSRSIATWWRCCPTRACAWYPTWSSRRRRRSSTRP